MQLFKKLRRHFFPLLTLACLGFLLSSFIAPSGFSGTWTLSESRSKLEQVRFNMVGVKLTVSQEANLLTIIRHTQGPNGDLDVTEKITLDGKESQNTVFETTVKKSVAKWSDDGKSLLISSNTLFERGGNTIEFKTTENWKLGDDGSLLIDFSSASSFGEAKGSYVFTK